MESKNKTVLIVEDEKNIVDILRFNLQREGYQTLEAYDGEAGLQQAIKSATPQGMPAFQSFGFFHLFRKSLGPVRKITSDRNSTARKQRTAWKVKGPIWFMPTLCATKAEPQIMVPRSKARLPRSLFFMLHHRRPIYHKTSENARAAQLLFSFSVL